VAKCVLLDAHDAADCLTDIQTHRDDMRDWREAQGAYRLNLTSETLWQAAAYMASERWEVID
jgi:hypothetical protein